MDQTDKPHETPSPIAPDGEYAITVNGSRTLPAKSGDSLRDALSRHNIYIPSACGGCGLCGYCKLKILDDAGPLTPAELKLLSEQEVASDVRLSCQVKVRQNLAIEIPQALFSAREFRGRVERVRNLTHDVKELRIRLLDPLEITFTPGQYVQLLIPPTAKHPKPAFRAFSIASPPSLRDCVDLIIRLVPNGICTAWVFNTLKEGDRIRLNGPYGSFHLSASDSEMFWIAGSSGIAPFCSMAQYMAENNIQRTCTCFLGALAMNDLFLVDEFREIERKLPRFRFVPALSLPDATDQWAGETGLITEIADKHIPTGTNAEVYLCGSGGMIDAALTVLKAKSIPAERIFYDKYT